MDAEQKAEYLKVRKLIQGAPCADEVGVRRAPSILGALDAAVRTVTGTENVLAAVVVGVEAAWSKTLSDLYSKQRAAEVRREEPSRRLDDTDLDALEAAALGRSGAGALAHPVDVLRLVAEVRWYKAFCRSLTSFTTVRNPNGTSAVTPPESFFDDLGNGLYGIKAHAPPPDGVRVVEPDRYMMRDGTPRPTGVPVPQFEAGAVLLHKFPELAGYARETTLDDGGRAVVTYRRNHESNAVPPGEFPVVAGYERGYRFDPRDRVWVVEYRQVSVPSFPKSAGGSDGDAPVVVTDGNN